MVPIVFGADSINIHECAGFRVKISKFLVNTISRRRKVRLVSYLGGRSPIVSRWSLLFLVSISLIFMSGRGLEINLSNADILRTKCPIHFQLALVTSLGSGKSSHTMTSSYLNNSHEWAGLRCKSFKGQYPEDDMSDSLPTWLCDIFGEWHKKPCYGVIIPHRYS